MSYLTLTSSVIHAPLYELQPDTQHVQDVGGKHLPGCGPACARVWGAGGAPGVKKIKLTPIVGHKVKKKH